MAGADTKENLILGIDLGIGSCGWAVIDESEPSDRIVALGVRTFDVPETDKERTPTNQLRRQHRGLRTVLRRRRQRMNYLRKLFQDAGLIPDDRKGALKIPGLDPWKLRAEGLDRKLTGPEFAVALGHIAKHRGFRSNSKRKSNEPASDDSKMLKAIGETQDRLKNYRTVGEMFARDPEFALRKHNRDSDYSRSVLRDDQEREARFLFDRQRAAGNRLATDELEREFIDKAFSQKPLADSEDKVGECPFEPGDKRAAKHSYSFELFRLLSRLTALRILTADGERPLSPEEITTASADFGGIKGMTFKRLRKMLDLDDGLRFAGIPIEEEGKRDVVSRSGDMAPGTYALRKVLGDTWRTLLNTPDKLDRVAFVLSFRDDVSSIRKGLGEIALEPLILDKLMEGVQAGEFGAFKGAGHISAKACRKIIPYLKMGLTYDKACAAAGYDHAVSDTDRFLNTEGLAGAAALRAILRKEAVRQIVGSPVARKAITEALKQIIAVTEIYGVPGRVHVELARDVGKSKEERNKIKDGLDKRTTEKKTHSKEFENVVGSPLSSEDDLLRYELWKEQNGFCLYTGRKIDPKHIIAADRTLEVDHIIPRGKSGDNSYHNKSLCFASANQEKKARTPYLWLEGPDSVRWLEFAAQVDRCKALHKQKRRNYLTNKSLAEIEEKLKPRNLNDTQFATKILLGLLVRMYPKGEQEYEIPKPGKPSTEKRRVFARPGRLTDALRRTWKIQDLKKDEAGVRISDDRHHALDALIVAATSEGALNRLTQQIQSQEEAGLRRDIVSFDPPWPDFRDEVRIKLREVFVSRAERRRGRGKAHDATIRRVAESDGTQIVYERKNIESVTEKDLDRIKNPERNAKLIASLREWIGAGKPKDRMPLSPKGDPIAKIRLQSDSKPGVSILRGLKDDKPGTADRSRIVRVDVFENKGRKGRSKYYFVPIYAHQIVERMPPDRIFTLRTDYSKWPTTSADTAFLFSLHPMCFVEVDWKERGAKDITHIEGYFRGIDVNDGRITISDHRSKDSKAKELQWRLSPTTIMELRKAYIDRLGRRFPIPKETRTWHGAVCT